MTRLAPHSRTTAAVPVRVHAVALLMVTPSGGPVGLMDGVVGSGVLACRLQAELLLALDLHDLAVVHGDFNRAELEGAQGTVDLAQDAGFVLPLEVANGRGHCCSP